MIYLIKTAEKLNPGGVEFEYRSLNSFLRELGIKSMFASAEKIIENAIYGDVVFIQEEGRLSAEYGFWAGALLDRGVILLEKNVFALPSKHRPIHPNYHMIVMSKDGAFRYSLRSFFVGNKQKKLIILPNFPWWVKTTLERDLKKSSTNGYELLVLRAGRPDMNKWTTLEIEIFDRIFESESSNSAKLTLVGAPMQIAEIAKAKKVNIECVDYVKNIEEYYQIYDTYILYSRIGETYGNTIFEAATSGMRIIYIFDLTWDCAPIEYLKEFSIDSYVCEISKVSQITKSTFQNKKTNTQIEFNDKALLENKSLFSGDYGKMKSEIPSFIQSCKYLYEIGLEFQVKRMRILRAIIIELFRESIFRKNLGVGK